MISSPSSSIAPRLRASRSSPKQVKLASTLIASPVSPSPTPRIIRPPESWSTAAASRATFHGRRRGSGVTAVPSAIRSVRTATAASTAHTLQVAIPRSPL